jgi:hypothetical protein
MKGGTDPALCLFSSVRILVGLTPCMQEKPAARAAGFSLDRIVIDSNISRSGMRAENRRTYSSYRPS